jgi:lipid-A-disaccharide synthase-like uncharacterized protein
MPSLGLAALVAAALLASVPPAVDVGSSERIRIDWSGALETQLVDTPAGPRVEIRGADGATEHITLDAFARRALGGSTAQAERRTPLERLFHVEGMGGILWVLFGLAGQAVFAGRMVVQWLASERRGLSVVPTVFWWMSLCGAAMLLSYFLWRRDIVGVLGQSLGFVIYVRNLMLIRRASRSSS